MMKTPTDINETGSCEEFIFKFPTKTAKAEYELKVPVIIPYFGIVQELTQRLVSSLKLPCYIEKDLAAALEQFVKEREKQQKDSQADSLVKDAQEGKTDLEDVVRQWESAFKTEVVEFCGPIALSDEELFAEAYHRLVHSPLLDKVLAGEQALSEQVATLVTRRDFEICRLNQKQAEEKSENEGGDGVNSLIEVGHIEAQELLEGEWESRLDALRATQRRDARSWLMNLSQQQQTSSDPSELPHSPVFPWPSIEPIAESSAISELRHQPPELQESFTIHLGSQMKQMHNIRLMACDVLSLCECRGEPQKLHTSLSLYSNELHGLVLFTDCQLPTSSRASAAFREVCQHGTELHFLSVEQQLEAISKQSTSLDASRQTPANKARTKVGLQPGDCYITKHSSLAEAHVVFHLLSDDTLLAGDVSSRHPVILGLRNILKTASAYDITCLSVPLLLVHEMAEQMTVAWCNRRAELVFKCIKGFMIETASWGGSELKTVQFILPKDISEDLFSNISTMLPSIFRVANPLKFKASNK